MSVSLSFIGSGNVATSLAKGFYAAGHRVVQVYSPMETHAQELAQQVSAAYTNTLSSIYPNADVYIVAVKDEAIESTLNALPVLNGLVVHTSGATDINVLQKFANYGVLYAPQSFTKEKELDLEQTTFCIEANTRSAFETLVMLVLSVSSHLHTINSQQRLALHVSAVLANNFTHYLLSQAQHMLHEENIPVMLLKSIIEETFQRLDFSENASWEVLQTGPALRGDTATIQKHLAYLHATQPRLEELYKTLSDLIQKREG